MILDAKNCIFPSQPAAAQQCVWVRPDFALELFVSDLAISFEAHGGTHRSLAVPFSRKKALKAGPVTLQALGLSGAS